MFVFTKPPVSEAVPVAVQRQDGQDVELLLRYRLLGPRERRAVIDRALRDRLSDADLVAQMLGGWDRMVDEAQQPVPCDAQHIAALLDELAEDAVQNICAGWVTACNEAARGNS